MVIGNFALLAGLDVKAVCEWYLAVYVDAYEWVELPNTAGMALHADNGAMASNLMQPVASTSKSRAIIASSVDSTRPKMTGEDACPFNSLYWRFIDRHQDYLEKNARMGLILANWRKRDSASREAILAWAEHCLEPFRLSPSSLSARGFAAGLEFPALAGALFRAINDLVPLVLPARPPIERALADGANLAREVALPPHLAHGESPNGQSAASVTKSGCCGCSPAIFV
jgi:hypothetical protein